MNHKITTRKYQPSDARALADIYYHTIHHINIRDYSQQQVDAWAPLSSLELAGWQQKWAKVMPIVAVVEDKLVGFAEFEANGHIDCFYVHHDYQGQGVGSALLAGVEELAREKGVARVYAEVSITARPFFAGKGFSVVKEQVVNVRGCELVNFLMEK